VACITSPPAVAGGGAGERSGAEVWASACASCHGEDGAGRPAAVVGFDVPLPNLRDCAVATSEPTPDWIAVVHEGGPVRGLNQIMPAFGDALSEGEIGRVVDYVRDFCPRLSAWPLGELNFPRALFTDKAFPEDEVVLTSTIALHGAGSVMNELVYEHRLGARSMFEVGVPFGFLNQTGAPGNAPGAPTGWTGGLGDLAIAFKQALVQSARSGTILALGAEARLPTGREDRGLGAGVTILAPFLALGQRLPAGAFVQVHAGADLPVDFDQSKPEAFWKGVVGWSATPSRFGRMYSPMIEVLGTRVLTGSAPPTTWDLVPQMQVTLSRRKHIRFDAGVDIPVKGTEDRQMQLVAYLLWDWFDGGPLEGW